MHWSTMWGFFWFCLFCFGFCLLLFGIQKAFVQFNSLQVKPILIGKCIQIGCECRLADPHQFRKIKPGLFFSFSNIPALMCEFQLSAHLCACSLCFALAVQSLSGRNLSGRLALLSTRLFPSTSVLSVVTTKQKSSIAHSRKGIFLMIHLSPATTNACNVFVCGCCSNVSGVLFALEVLD